MGKRGNENAQMRREDYEALESRGSSGELAGSFARASEEELSKRRIIRRARKPAPSPAAPAPAGAESGAGRIFANVDLGVPPSSDGGASASGSSKPKFAMPTMPGNSTKAFSTTASTKNPFGNVSITAPTAAPAASQATSYPSALSENPKLESDSCFLSFKDFMQKAQTRRNLQLPVKRFVATMLSHLQKEEKEARKENKAGASNMPKVTGSSSTSAAISSAPTLFASATAPVSFSFGTSAPGPAPAPSSKPTFSFKGSSSPAPAPAPAPFSGFSFSPAPTTAAPDPGSNIKVALSPVPGPDAAGDNAADDDAPQQDTEPSIVEGNADDDWNQVMTVKIRAYHYRNEKKMTKFASGGVKLQQQKANPKSARLVLRDTAGKVLLNVGISKDMPIRRKDQTPKPGKTPTSLINFVGILDAGRGAESFALICSQEDADTFYSKLKELTS